MTLDLDRVPTPCFVLDETALKRNLKILASVQDRTGCRILLALKGFSMFSVFPMIRQTLHGVCASSPHEARLGREEFGREVHTFAAAYSDEDMREIIPLSDHIVFNSFALWQRFRPMIDQAPRPIRCGIRINPAHSEVEVPIYDPCAPGSRLGVLAHQFQGQSLDGLSGLHFHTLCEKNADALARTLEKVEAQFEPYIRQMEWVNFGGGHHITRDDYDVDLLCRLINDFKEKYEVAVYLEPGEAVALNAGVLVASVLDIVENDMRIAILDTSAATHMPDVLEMPYRPEIIGAGRPGEKPYSYRLAGLSCLAGDVIGDYSFEKLLAVGDKLVFCDMAHYSMVKTNTFNGIKLPSIAIYNADTDEFTIIRKFGYDDFKNRLS
ncbi:MAG: carboxynorspermidine decarboxylase [Desulfobacterales bacterium CG23_combo_of_CG06-09_8_20_14_all_51_8]|nr:MAG: carboxynorspermidine decarboxylase [Desulfobacterales bacterium CG23_combo_of_CG06-09_8_20_14_all_51_8]